MPADLVDEGLRFEAWTIPSAGDFKRRFDLSKWVNSYTVSDKFNEISDGRIVLPSGEAGLPQSRIDRLLTVDKQNHANDDGSVIRVLQGTEPIIHYVCKNALDSWQSDEPIVTCSLEGMEFFLDRARVPNYDAPANPTREPDWIYGAASVLTNTGFEDAEITNERVGLTVVATAGTFKIGTDIGAGFVYTANISFFPGAADIANAIEASRSGWDVTVTGAGTPANPFIIELIAPAGTGVTWATDQALLTGSANIELSQKVAGGVLLAEPWTRSLNPTTGVFHGSYTTFTISDEQAHSGTYSLKVDGDPPASPGAFAGAQQIMAVTPGRTYRASIWVRPTGSGPFRFVIRTWDETFIAQSEATLSAGSWQQMSIPSVTIPTHVNRIIFRIANVGNTDPPAWYVDDALFAPGRAAATYGFIMGELLSAVQAEGVLTWVTKTWTDTHDSAGVAWDQDLQWAVRRGQTLQQLTEYARKWRYENGGLRWSTANNRFEWDLFNPTTGGTNHQGTGLVILGRTGVTSSGTIARRIPDATFFHTEGDAGQWGDAEDAILSGVWGKLQKYYPNAQGLDTTGLDILADRLIDDATDRTDGISVRLQASTVRPWQRFRPADKVTVNLSPKRSKELLRCMAIVASKDTGQATPAYDVHFGSVVYQGEAAVLQSLRTLMRKFDSLVTPATRESIVGGITPALLSGSGGAPTVTIAPVDSSVLSKSKADLVSGGGGNDQVLFEQALTLLGVLNTSGAQGGRILLTEGTFTFSAGVTLSHDVTIEGMGRTATRIRIPNLLNSNIDLFTSAVVNRQARITFRGLTLDGNRANNTAGTQIGFVLNQNVATDLLIQDCRFVNFRTKGLEVNRSGGITMLAQSYFINNAVEGASIFFDGWGIVNQCRFSNNGIGLRINANQAIVTNNIVNDNTGVGIIGEGTNETGRHLVANNRIFTNGSNGIELSSTLSTQSIIANNHVYANSGRGIWSRGAVVVGNFVHTNTLAGIEQVGFDGDVIVGNKVLRNGQHGILLVGGRDVLVASNKVHWNGATTNNTYDGIHVRHFGTGEAGASQRVNVRDNIIDQPASGNRQRYAINIDSNLVDDAIVVGNDGRTGGQSGTTLGDNWGSFFNNAGDGTISTYPGSGGGGGGADELSDLTDVDTAGVTDGQILRFDSGTSTWLPDDEGSGSDPSAIHDDVAGEISAITAKATPVAGDFLLIEDSEDSDNKKSITIGDLPGGSGTDDDAIHDNVAGEIDALTQVTPAAGDWLLIEDDSDSFNKKKIDVADIAAAAGAIPDTLTTKGDILTHDGSVYDRLPAGTDGHVLTADSGEALGVKWAAGGGGGGGGFLLDPNLKPPGSPHASDVEFQTVANATNPTTLGLQWANQNGRSGTVQGGVLHLTNPGAANNYGGLVVAAPSGTWSMVTRMQSWNVATRHGFGLLVINDSPLGTFANYRWCIRHVSGDPFRASNINSSWNFGGTNGGTRTVTNDVMPWVYMRMAWNSSTSTLTFDVTNDPQAGWYPLHSVGSLATPTFAGFLLTGESAAVDAFGSFSFLRFNWTPDYDPTA